MKKPSPNKRIFGYAAVLAVTLAVAIVLGWTSLASQIDDDAYDVMFRLHPPPASPPHCQILAIDDATYGAMGGVRAYRSMLGKALELLAPAQPKVVAIDMVLADQEDAPEDDRLLRAMQSTKNLVLVAHLQNGLWEDPLDKFRRAATALGHDRADERSRDGVTRQIPLEERTDRERHWALALETYRLARGQRILESPGDLQIGNEVIPAPRTADNNRSLRVLFSREPIPQISLLDLVNKPELAARFRGQTVFVGVTSIDATYDRVATPYGEGRIPGVEVHAQLLETLERGKFLTSASNLLVLGCCVLVGVLAGLIFLFLSGWSAYTAAGILLVVAPLSPFFFFRQGIVFPFFALFASAWLTAIAAASYQHFVVRRALLRSETERQHYQQAIHFVTHEMRTPLTAIQGSSELMGRYNLSEEKRKQIAEMINQESKRLARMIQTFLDVERLSDGQMELKGEAFEVRQIVEACVGRARPLAERKNIRIVTETLDGTLEGDRELMEYAVYNLLNNAIKYSPPDTQVTVGSEWQGAQLRLFVRDQGIGMDAKELRQIFQKFYRTKRAEASGEAGTGIGLSIVEQIVQHHGGKMEVTSQPGQGSCFTVVFGARARASRPPAVSV
ncbi:MAG: CHASE2 domain-containing protein [Bryobacteraceae bacterium]